MSLSLDGYVESSDGKIDFAKSRSPEGAAWVGEKMAQAGAHLLGRKSFVQFSSFWPTASIPLAKTMNEIPKIVFSRQSFKPADLTAAKGWADARVMSGDLAAGIAALKNEPGKDLLAHGGLEFARSLVQTGLVDEYWIATHPVAAGSGVRLFDTLSRPLYLRLVEAKVFNTGAMLNVYRPD